MHMPQSVWQLLQFSLLLQVPSPHDGGHMPAQSFGQETQSSPVP
jgi:hypothetical protein